jgi:hypothetical protein
VEVAVEADAEVEESILEAEHHAEEVAEVGQTPGAEEEAAAAAADIDLATAAEDVLEVGHPGEEAAIREETLLEEVEVIANHLEEGVVVEVRT